LPVVATDTSSIIDVIRHGETGLLVSGEDISALAAAVRSLRDDPMLWAAMSEAARDRQKAEFSEAKMVEGYLAAYRLATGRRSVQAAKRA
jgi:glycosyltransferase involved in cell wall biosynthesis